VLLADDRRAATLTGEQRCCGRRGRVMPRAGDLCPSRRVRAQSRLRGAVLACAESPASRQHRAPRPLRRDRGLFPAGVARHLFWLTHRPDSPPARKFWPSTQQDPSSCDRRGSHGPRHGYPPGRQSNTVGGKCGRWPVSVVMNNYASPVGRSLSDTGTERPPATWRPSRCTHTYPPNLRAWAAVGLLPNQAQGGCSARLPHAHAAVREVAGGPLEYFMGGWMARGAWPPAAG
jgi:hypothetical protein